MKTYILFVICGSSVSNKLVSNDAVTFAKKADTLIGFGTNIVEIWENNVVVEALSWNEFKRNLIKYI